MKRWRYLDAGRRRFESSGVRATLGPGFGHALATLRAAPRSWSVSFAFGDQIRSSEEAIKGPRIGPPAFQYIPRHISRRYVFIIDIGDFKLPASAGLKSPGYLEDAMVVHVNAYHGVWRRRLLRLFLDPDYCSVLKDRHTEPLWIVNFAEQDFGAGPLMPELLYRGADAVLENVISQHYTDRSSVRKVLRQRKCRCNPVFAFLICIVQV